MQVRLGFFTFMLWALLLPLQAQPRVEEAVAAAAAAGDPGAADEPKRTPSEFNLNLGAGSEIDPYGPTPQDVVDALLKLAETGEDDLVYDLGSGDGRIPITAARAFGARGVGIELRPELVEKSRAAAKDAGVEDRVEFVEEDIFKHDLGNATVVTLYLFPRTNLKLRPKLLKELRPGTRVVAFRYSILEWPPDQVVDLEYKLNEESTFSSSGKLFYWMAPANATGRWDVTVKPEQGDEQQFTLHLDQTFQQVSGTAGMGDKKVPLEQVEIRGETLTFTLQLPEMRSPLRFEGKVEEHGAKGTAASAGDGLKAAWEATRDPQTRTSIDTPEEPGEETRENPDGQGTETDRAPAPGSPQELEATQPL